ncbi:MAG: DUF5106 domain-containing protein [Alistipes sp.]|nr:DUF5106 domain-containing protein [Alistipes sp.]
MRATIFALILIFFGFGCTPKPKKHTPKSYHFRFVEAPAMATEEQQVAYMRDHFWDKFDFADTLYTTKADTTEMMRAYAAYVANFVGPLNQEPIRKLMKRASVSKKMFDYFVMLAEKVLHYPNSPYRSDELYIAVLEAQLASPYYDKYEKMAPEYDLRVVSQNRIGQSANDFDYTDRTGRTRNMYSLKNDFVIVYINNPGCAMCRDITEALKQSPIISDLQQQGRLKVLAIYPDENLDEWHKHLSDMPAEWINGYDRGCRIERENLYNVSAIPALYLLDKEKKVLVKDSTNVGEIEAQLMANSQ